MLCFQSVLYCIVLYNDVFTFLYVAVGNKLLLLKMIYYRDYVNRKAISYNDDALWQTYRSLRNVVTSTIRRKQKLYYDSKITDCQSNPKQL